MKKVTDEDVNPIKRYLAIDDMLNSKEHELQILGMVALWPISNIPTLIKNREKLVDYGHAIVKAGIGFEVDRVVEIAEDITKELLEILDKL